MLAGNQAHAFAPLADRPLGRLQSVLSLIELAYPRVSPAAIAGKKTHQVHEVRPQHHQVFPTGAAIFFTAGTHFQQVPE